MTKIPEWPVRDPSDTRRLGLRGWLAHLGDGDKVVAASWTASPTGGDHVTIADAQVSGDGDATSMRPLGGVPGVPYLLTCHATLESGATVDRSAYLLIQQR